MSITGAMTLAKQGIACFPCLATKRPATPHGFKDASRDRIEIERLWRQFTGPLIGVSTGAGNRFDVVDIDPRHGGMAWWEANRHALPPTRIHRTRSGGSTSSSGTRMTSGTVRVASPQGSIPVERAATSSGGRGPAATSWTKPR
jgi:hypothetical protein